MVPCSHVTKSNCGGLGGRTLGLQVGDLGEWLEFVGMCQGRLGFRRLTLAKHI